MSYIVDQFRPDPRGYYRLPIQAAAPHFSDPCKPGGPLDIRNPAIPHFIDLLRLPEADFNKLDIAWLNLLTASGLPGAENVDIPGCLKQIDQMAAHVGAETERHLYKFKQNPAAFRNSLPYFRLMCLATVLQQDCGVTYNMDLIRLDDDAFERDARNLFIHGILGGTGGTCCSLPVLNVAVGRRLGYPFRLVSAKRHSFARWDDPKTGERVNLECASHGFSSFPDEYYLTFPERITSKERKRYQYLKSHTHKEDFAAFIKDRGRCWESNDCHRRATICYAIAHCEAPHSPVQDMVKIGIIGWHRALQQTVPPNFPDIRWRMKVRRFPNLDLAVEKAIVGLELKEALVKSRLPTHQAWWRMLRQSPHRRPAEVPTEISIHDPLKVLELHRGVEPY